MKFKDSIVNLSLAALSGFLTYLAFPPFEFSSLVWVSFIPLFFVIKASGEKAAFLYSYFSGAVFFGFLINWLLNVTVPGAIILILFLALFYGIFGYFVKLVFKYSIELFLLPFIWIILEYIRSYIFTGFPWALLGYSQYENINLIQISDITGAWGVSLMIMAFNTAFFSFLIKDKSKILRMVIVIILMIFSLFYSKYKTGNLRYFDNVSVAVIQGNIPQKLKWDESYSEEIIKKYIFLTKEASRENPDIIIWPETAYPYLLGPKENPEEVISLASELNTPILAGAVYYENPHYYNSAVLLSKEGKILDKYNKNHLVPFGEYIPFREHINWIKKYINKPIGEYTKGDILTLFPVSSVAKFTSAKGDIARSTGFYKFGVLICFEDIFPYLSRELKLEGADFIVNITNDAWFGKSAAPRQHLQASVFRAVENGVSLVRAANTGVSCFIDPMGNIYSYAGEDGNDIFVDAFKTERILISKRQTLYSLNGDIIILVGAWFIIFTLIFHILRSRRRL